MFSFSIDLAVRNEELRKRFEMNPSAVSSVPTPVPAPVSQARAVPGSAPNQPINQDELVRIFNTALVASHAGPTRDFSNEIYELMENPAFRAILGTVRQFARLQGLSERQAAEQIITTFRKMDRVWSDYVFHEGVERLKGSS
jgi:hypothetical protein